MVSVPVTFGTLLAARIRYGHSVTLALASAYATVGHTRSPVLLKAWKCAVVARKLILLMAFFGSPFARAAVCGIHSARR